MNKPCKCDSASGWCEQFKREMSKREKQICQGVNCPLSVTSVYQKGWLKERQESDLKDASGDSVVTITSGTGVKFTERTTAKSNQPKSILASITSDDIPCEYRGEKLRDHKCVPCRGSFVIPVFECKHPETNRKECSLALTVAGAAKCSSCQFGGEEAFEDFIESRKSVSFTKSDSKSLLESKNSDLEPQPFIGPVKRILLFYLWENYDIQRHKELLKKYATGYDRKIMCCAYNTEGNHPDVKSIFDDGWEHISVKNDPKLREVVGYRKMFPMVANEGENTIITCAHAKGAQQHTRESEVINWWTEAMYATVVGNPQEIEDALSKGYIVAGSFRRLGKHFGCKYRYHYSGTFYSLRASEFFKQGIPKIKDRYWGTESLPGDVIPLNKSYCIFGDNVDDMYKLENQPRDAFLEWEKSHLKKVEEASV